jgi:acyl-CoA reductase-like NAD-dependent aldehyde dehydrogenase
MEKRMKVGAIYGVLVLVPGCAAQVGLGQSGDTKFRFASFTGSGMGIILLRAKALR